MADRSVSVALYANVTGYVAGIKTAQAATSSFISDLEKSQKKQQALKSLGNAAGVMGLGFAAAAGATVFFAARFDQSMSKVQAASHESAKNMDLLRQAAIEAGAKTKFSASEAADAITALAKAGVSSADVLNGGLAGALNLAAAGELDVGQAAEIAAVSMNQFGLAGKDIPHIADLLAAAAGKAMGEVTDMAAALKFVGPVAAQMGVSIEETTGTIAELAQAGIQGEQAGTSLRGMLTALTSPSKIAKTQMDALGISMYDAQGKFVGLDGVAGQLHDNMKNLTNAERDQALGRIFGNEQITAARILYAGGSQAVDKWTKAVNDQGYAAETAAIKMDNLAGDIEQFKGSLETAFIGTGEGAQGPLRSLVQELTTLTNLYISLPGPVKEAGLATTAFLAVAGGGLFVFSRVAAGLASMGTNLETLGLRSKGAEGPLGNLNAKMIAMRAGVFAAGVGLKVLANHLEDSHKSLAGFADVAGDVAMGFAIGGPWGAAIGAGVGLLGLFMKGSEAAAASQADLADVTASVTSTLDQQTGALTQNTVAYATNRLATKGAYDAASQLGISQDLVTKAALGNADAVRQFNAAMHDAAGSMDMLNGGELTDSAKAWQLLNTTVGNTSTGISDSKKAIQQAQAAQKGLAVTADGSTVALGREQTAATDAAKAIKDLTDAQNKNALAAIQAKRDQIALIETYKAAETEARQGAKTLDINTAAGRKNFSMLLDLADQINGTKGAANESVGAFEQQRKEFVKVAEQMGANSDKAKALSVKYLAIPTSVTTKITADVTDAMSRVAAFIPFVNDKLGQIDDEKVNVSLSAQAQKVEAQLGGFSAATGGPVRGPGSGTSDSIVARLSDGEHVWTAAEVSRAGGHGVVEGLRRLAMMGELPRRGDVSAFAGGGPVIVPSVSSSGVGASVNRVESMFEAIATAIGVALSKKLSDLLTHLPTAGQLGPGGVLTPAQLARGQNAASSMVGMPYVWGGSDPGDGGFDCSGFQSWILHKARGDTDLRRIGSTSTMPWSGSHPGVGRYSIGWTTNAGDGIGHTSGNIGGLNVESYGGHGPAVGSGARSPLDSMFNGLMHYDSGGILKPGLTLARNNTGKDEHVSTADQLAHAIAVAFAHFGFGPKATADKVKSEVGDLISALRDALGKDSPLLDHVKRLGDNLIKAAKAQDRVSAHLDALRDRMDAYAATVAGNFRNDPFGNGASGLVTQLKADRNDARRMQRALREARKKGLSGGLLKELAASGDFGTAQEIADMSRAQIHHLEVLYHQRQTASGSLGQYAGQQVFGQQIKEQNRELHHLNHTIKKLEHAIEHMGHHVQAGAHKGTRDGARDGMRDQGRRAAHQIR